MINFNNRGNFAVVTALVLGMDDYLDNDTRKEFSSAGAIHILCVSGLHVGVIYMVLNALLFFLKRNKYARALRSLILLIGIWFYAMLTGLAPAVLRAATMFSFVIIGTGIKRKAGVFNSLTVSAFILLLFNPFLIYNVGFQLSYAAVIAIVAIQPTIYQIWRPKNKIADNIWGITTVSVAAQLGTAPLGLFYFHQFPNYFIITNLIAIPLATLILYAGFLSVILSPLTIVAKWITWLLILMLKILNQSVTFIDNLPYSVTTGLFINLAETIILFLIIFTVFRAYLSRKPIFLHFSLLLLILFAVSGTIKQYQRSTQKQLTVYSINRYSVIDLITGRNSILLADSLVLKDPASIEFQVSNHHVYKGINQEQIITFNDCFFKEQALSENIPAKINCPLIQFDNRHILLVDKDLPTWNGDSAYNLDLLILIDNNNDAERVLKN
ncbi:MAG TPA: ComEC/Rec2 family competence protein, partial [Bacteroidales bacterium]|nr:ComEC/Rec2 family competence protein [Bacteroidales bacterium]